MQNYNIIFHDLGFVQMFYFLVGNTLMQVSYYLVQCINLLHEIKINNTAT